MLYRFQNNFLLNEYVSKVELSSRGTHLSALFYYAMQTIFTSKVVNGLYGWWYNRLRAATAVTDPWGWRRWRRRRCRRAARARRPRGPRARTRAARCRRPRPPPPRPRRPTPAPTRSRRAPRQPPSGAPCVWYNDYNVRAQSSILRL